MASVTTTGSGNWNSATLNAPWPSGIPAATDTIIIGDTFTLTVPSGYTAVCGDAANPTTPSVQTFTGTGTGILVVNGTLQVYGDMKQGNSEWSVLGTGIIESKNTTTALVWYTSPSPAQPNAKTTIVGTSVANPARIRKGTGSAGFRCTVQSGHSSRLQFASLENLGSSTNNGWHDGGFADGYSYDWQDSVVSSCGIVYFSISENNPWSFQRVLIKDALHAQKALEVIGINNVAPTATRLMQDVHITKGIFRSVFIQGLSFIRCVMLDAFEFAGAWAEFTDCVTCDDIIAGDYSSGPGGSMLRGMRVRRVASRDNWHGFTYNGTAAVTVDGMIFDGVILYDANESGDLIMQNNVSLRAVSIKNCLTTKSNTVDGVFGNLVSMLGGASASIPLVENNTVYSRDASSGALIGVGETYEGYSNMVGAARNNLVVGLSAGSGTMVMRDNTGASFGGVGVRNLVTPGNITNNCCYQQKTDAVNGNGYRKGAGGDGFMWTTNPAATLDANPQFVDDTRNLAKWYRSLVGGTPGTREADTNAALNAIVSQYDLSPVSGATIVAAQTYIRAGYAPTNSSLRTNVSANNGGWIGAVTGVAGGSAARGMMLFS